jgi:hypothetical protein
MDGLCLYQLQKAKLSRYVVFPAGKGKREEQHGKDEFADSNF